MRQEIVDFITLAARASCTNYFNSFKAPQDYIFLHNRQLEQIQHVVIAI
jgi:mRNA deadenylase 3'-5' endonuclease subunit Ccr4